MQITIPSKVIGINVRTFLGFMLMASWAASSAWAVKPAYYIKKDTWQETIRASTEALMKLEQTGEMGMSLPDLGRSDFTVMAWIKTQSPGGTIIAKAPLRGGWAPQGKALFLQEGMPTFDVGWVGAVEAKVQVNDGKWHHLAIVKKADKLEFYADGRSVAGGTLKLGPDVSDHALKIGYCSRDFPEQSGFEGDIDEVRIYNRRLSADQIKAVYDNEKEVSEGLAGWWQFENGAADSSGNGNRGQIVRAESIDGRFGKALRFSGRSRVTLPASRTASARKFRR
jgi:hypothetical protein